MIIIDNTYNFTTKSFTILKGEYKNLKAVANLGYKQVVKYSGVFNDVATIRQQLMLELGSELLPVEVVRYFLFEDSYGNEVLLAEDWIDSDTIVVVDSVSGIFTVPNITTTDIVLISDMIKAIGYNNVTSVVG